jgi:hypothetical protein
MVLATITGMGLIVNLGTVIGHVVALPESFTKTGPQGFARLAIVVTQHRLDRRCGGFQMVVGNAQEDVVGHMGANMVVDRVKNPIVSVDGRQGTL